MRRYYYTSLAMVLVVAVFTTQAAGQTTQAGSSSTFTKDSSTCLSLQHHREDTSVEQPAAVIPVASVTFAATPIAADPVTAAEETVSSPFSYGLEYSVYSDYIFRGINFSELPREGRERLNHQLSVDFGVDLGLLCDREAGSMGTLSFNAWFEWFAAQKKIDPISGGQNLQEVDYTISWSRDIESLGSTLTLGYVFYTFPNAKALNTQELTIALEHNDAWMWKWLWPQNEDGVLNPSFFYGMDVDAISGGSWIEIGISHEFQVAQNLTLTPGITAAIDHRYLDPILGTGRNGSTRLAYMQYGLTLGYDLSAALKISESVGSWSMSSSLYFNDAVGNAEDNGVIQDEFFGNISIGVSF